MGIVKEITDKIEYQIKEWSYNTSGQMELNKKGLKYKG